MKKFLFLCLIASFGCATSRAAAKSARSTLVEQVETCEAILQEFQKNRDSAPSDDAWKKARAVIITNQFKAGFILGMKGGYGVVLVKKPDGQWSIPVLINAGEASLGLQLGANAIETVYILTDDATPRLLYNSRFNIGVDAKAVAGPRAADAESNNRDIIGAPVLVYTKARGLYAGATVKAGYVSRNDQVNFTLYNTQFTLPELLYSDWVKPQTAAPEVLPLMELMKKLAP
jgi:lipid-binding SYLF domain-containing protein